MPNNKQKIVVFDLDETLGYFVELGIFWDSLHNYAKSINADIKKIFTLLINVLVMKIKYTISAFTARSILNETIYE